jgi:thiol-disulfide isomerase/thioredoxin
MPRLTADATAISMRRIPRRLIAFLTPCCGIFLLALQVPDHEFEQELAAGKQALERGASADAIQHFTRANELQKGKCSECYVWQARIEMATGKLREASEHTEKALATAATDAERSKAQLYRGMVFGRQGDLAQAEPAFKAASAANPACVECRFNFGFVLLKEGKYHEGVAALQTVVREFAGTPRGREIQRFIDDPSRARKNYAPEFSARSRTGEEINLDTLKGKVVLLDFWGTWCQPCRVALPSLKELAAKVDPAKVAIVSVDEGDSKESWERFVEKNAMTWFQLYDGDRSLQLAFAVDGYPRYYVLSKDGIILEQFKGWKQNGEATISDALARALHE